MPTVSGTVTDAQGNSASWSATWTVGGSSLLLPAGRVEGKVIAGLCTDNYTTRVNELGRPIGADHFFESSWNVNAFISDAQLSHSRGVLPFGNMKVGDWSTAANGSMDAAATQLGNAIAALGYPVRVTFHHEPGGNFPTDPGADAGTCIEWRDMLIRLLPRVKAAAPNAIVGPIDNGFKWSAGSQGWTDSELNQIYTDQLLSVCDVLGADYYDGATTRTNGEPAVVKVQRAQAWAIRRGWTGPMDIGEWNFVKPQDCDDMTSFLTANASRWWCANMFDSDTNNRTGIPTIGAKWGLNHGFDTPTDRLEAARRHFDHALTFPT